MEAQLDATLVASQHISDRMRVNKSTYETELANGIGSLSPLKQMQMETHLNSIYGEMKQKEREECLQKWNTFNNTCLVTLKHYYHISNDAKYARFTSTTQALKFLQSIITTDQIRVRTHRDGVFRGVDASGEEHPILQWPLLDMVFVNSVKVEGNHVVINESFAYGDITDSHTHAAFTLLGIEPVSHYSFTPKDIVACFGSPIPTSMLAKVVHFKGVEIVYKANMSIHVTVKENEINVGWNR